jgi:hypothetical protein
MRIPQRAGAAAPAVRPARRFSIGRGGEAGSAACARIRARDAPADVMEIENLIRYTALVLDHTGLIGYSFFHTTLVE